MAQQMYPPPAEPPMGQPQDWRSQDAQHQGGHPQNWQPQYAHEQGGHPQDWRSQDAEQQGGHPQNWQPQYAQQQGARPQDRRPQNAQQQGGHPQDWQPQNAQQQGRHPQPGAYPTQSGPADGGLDEAMAAAARRGNRALIGAGVAAAIGVAALALAIVTNLEPLEATCGGDVMTPGDVCEHTSTSRRGGTFTEEYGDDEAVRRESLGRLMFIVGPILTLIASAAILYWNWVVAKPLSERPASDATPLTRWHGAQAGAVGFSGLIAGPLLLGVGPFAYAGFQGRDLLAWGSLAFLIVLGSFLIWTSRPRPAELVRTDERGLQLTRGDQTVAVLWGAVSNAKVVGRRAEAHWKFETQSDGTISLAPGHTQRAILGERISTRRAV